MSLYTVVYDMSESTKMIRVSPEVHARIKTHCRKGETLNDTFDRLIRGPSLKAPAGILSDAKTAKFEATIDKSYRLHEEELSQRFNDQR